LPKEHVSQDFWSVEVRREGNDSCYSDVEIWEEVEKFGGEGGRVGEAVNVDSSRGREFGCQDFVDVFICFSGMYRNLPQRVRSVSLGVKWEESIHALLCRGRFLKRPAVVVARRLFESP